MTSPLCAILFTALAALPFAMHLALSVGAPLGRFTVGGRFPGQLPPLWRVLALVQAGILAAMAVAVLQRAGLVDFGWPHTAFWVALALSVITFAANAASPSRPERLLWAPVTALMALSASGVAFL